MSAHKEYLGDGVYADVDDYGGVVLTTENGIVATNTIVLEPVVLASFQNWCARIAEARDDAARDVKATGQRGSAQ